MLDLSYKYPTFRSAVAEAKVHALPSTLEAIRNRQIPKGDPIEVAKVAGIQAAKNTSSFIPFCHPINITYTGLEFDLADDFITVRATVKAIAITGVEMEALTAASAAALTLYDMLKMLDDTMEIAVVRLVEKRGGKGDFRERPRRPLTAAVLVMSDSIAAGKKSDASGLLIKERLEREGLEVKDYRIIADDLELIASTLADYSDNLHLDLVVTTGGTGFSPRDCTPEAMARVVERFIPGIPEAARGYGQARTPYSMLSRAMAGLRGDTLIVNLPGSKRGVAESLNALFPALLHAFPMIWGESGWKSHHKTGDEVK